MAVSNAVRGTGNVLAASLALDFSKQVLDLEPKSMPLLVFTKNLNKERAVNPDFNWFEDQGLPRFDAVNNGAGYTNVATSIVVDNGAYFQVDDQVYVSRTGEVMRVTLVATNTLTVVRGIGGGNAALLDNDELIIIGPAYQEGALDDPPKTQNLVQVTNYCQIFRKPVEETETMRSSSQVVTPHDWDRARNRIGIEHGKDIEYAFLFGRPSKDTSGTHPRRTTGGAYYFMTQNQTDAGGALSDAELFSAMRPAFRNGSDKKLGLASMLVTDVISGLARGKVVIAQSEKVFGIQIVRVVSPHGTINLTTHRLLEGAKFGNEMLIIDVEQTGYRYLAGDGPGGARDTHIRENIQAPGADTRKDEYLTECGLKFGLPSTHAKLTNVTS